MIYGEMIRNILDVLIEAHIRDGIIKTVEKLEQDNQKLKKIALEILETNNRLKAGTVEYNNKKYNNLKKQIEEL